MHVDIKNERKEEKTERERKKSTYEFEIKLKSVIGLLEGIGTEQQF